MAGSSFFPLNIKNYQLKSTSNVPSYIEKEPSSDSDAGVRSENWFVVYARYTTLVKLTKLFFFIRTSNFLFVAERS